MPARKIYNHILKSKKQARQYLTPCHDILCTKCSWYKWWHNQDYHRHIHYLAMITGIIVAVYFVMIDEIMSKVNL